jgi:hypothetical protein
MVHRAVKHRELTLVVLCWALPACTCGEAPEADAAVRDDTPAAPDSRPEDIDAYALPDAGSVSDAPILAPICGEIVATTCPTQTRENVSACPSGEGAVFFDGTHCQQTASASCGPERGAFRSFEECAVVCEAAGQCDASKLAFTNPDGPAACETPTGGPDICTGAVGMLVDEPALIECESFRDLFVSCDDNRPHRCSPEAARFVSWEEVWLPFRRASLLPFVSALQCGLGGP